MNEIFLFENKGKIPREKALVKRKRSMCLSLLKEKLKNNVSMTFNGYPVFKGLQKPLEFMGIRGRFLTYAAGAIGISFMGYIVFSILLGKFAGFIAMIIMAAIGLASIYLKQKTGLHNKKKSRGVFIYNNLYKH